jgi:hypothetical protein
MSDRQQQNAPPNKETLDLPEAAAHFRVLPETIARLQYEKIFPNFDAERWKWWRSTLEASIGALLRDGVPVGRKLPYTYVVPRKLVDETYRYHPRWRHADESKDLDGPRGSAVAARQWLEFERDYARRHPSPETPQAPPRQVAGVLPDQSAAAPQPGGQTGAVTQKFATRRSGAVVKSRPEHPRASSAASQPASPARRLSILGRRRARVTQAEIARVIRAAKQAGAAQVEVRLSDSGSILIRLQPDDPLASDEEIIL